MNNHKVSCLLPLLAHFLFRGARPCVVGEMPRLLLPTLPAASGPQVGYHLPRHRRVSVILDHINFRFLICSKTDWLHKNCCILLTFTLLSQDFCAILTLLRNCQSSALFLPLWFFFSVLNAFVLQLPTHFNVLLLPDEFWKPHGENWTCREVYLNRSVLQLIQHVSHRESCGEQWEVHIHHPILHPIHDPRYCRGSERRTNWQRSKCAMDKRSARICELIPDSFQNQDPKFTHSRRTSRMSTHRILGFTATRRPKMTTSIWRRRNRLATPTTISTLTTRSSTSSAIWLMQPVAARLQQAVSNGI